ncbi:ribokinase [Actinoalloteichus caeruleus]|uniref:ribokinase n=1 Tax=Actinoalloteichus cyanogriseus TaxID=2893586 RepID=UPI0004AA0B4F|nr:ribokinase [Actinoalloteichus caeruleus]
MDERGGVLVVGSANADLVVTVDRRPGPGETVLGSDTTVAPGGKGANLAVAAARLGGRVSLLAAVGTDQHGDLLRASLRDAGVGTDLVRDDERPTGVAYITVTADGENSIVVAPGANSSVSEADVDAASHRIATATVLTCSLEVPLPAVRRAVRVATEAGVRVVVNLSPVADLGGEVLGALDPLIVNEHEASHLLAAALPGPPGAEATGPPSVRARRTARDLLALGPRSAVVTLGPAGAVVAERDAEPIMVPAPPVRAVDSTGAGDAFAGALVARLAGGASLIDAARTAVRAAALSVTRPGAQPSFARSAELGPT